jgi:Uma2 family endonuclease
MSVSIPRPPRPAIVYPDSDGEPIAENTLEYEWIVTIKGNLDVIFAERPDIFVAGDLLWYPVEGDPGIRMAPDVMVAFGRPKGYRGSYRQWEEGGVPPQVVFEILSPGNRAGKTIEKFKFYQTFGVEEYYIYDPDGHELGGYSRRGEELIRIREMHGWVSPLLGIRFDCSQGDLRLFDPRDRPFLAFTEIAHQRDTREQERDTLEQERDTLQMQGAAMRQELAAERERAEKLAERLKELGIDPES